MVTAELLAYPVLAFAPHGVVYEVEAAPKLQQCNALAWKRRYFNKVKVFDAEGREYRVASAVNPRVVKGGLLRLIGNPIRQVDLQLEPGDIVTIEDLKAMVRKAVASHPEMWQSSDEDERIGERIQAAPTIRELFRLFAGRVCSEAHRCDSSEGGVVTASELKYPAVVVTNYGYAYSVRGASELQRCNSIALRKGHFRRLSVVDAAGREFLAVRYSNPRVVAGGILRRLFRGPMMEVDLELEMVGRLDLGQVKGKLKGTVSTHPEMWQATEEDEGISARIDGAVSLPELYQLFSERQ